MRIGNEPRLEIMRVFCEICRYVKYGHYLIYGDGIILVASCAFPHVACVVFLCVQLE